MTSSPASHRRTISESMFSQGVSPSDSFRTTHWNFLAPPGTGGGHGFAGDFIFALPDPNASPSVSHAKETLVDAVPSQRERLRWTSASSPSDFVISEEDSSDQTPEPMPATSRTPPVELLTCGICSRWLSQRSLSSHRLVAGIDPPVVGVLACGHVFHADCLEQQSQKHDPPCPQCSPPEKPSKSTVVTTSRGFFKSISHASSSTKYKLSRVGVVTDDVAPPTVTTGKGANHLCRLPSSSNGSGSGGSGVKSHISSFFSERAKPFSRKAFPFKTGRRDAMVADGKFRKPGSPARVSPAKDIMDLDGSHLKDSFRVGVGSDLRVGVRVGSDLRAHQQQQY